MTGLSADKNRKLYEAMENMTLSYDSAIEFIAIMNNGFFNSLSEEQKTIILETANTGELALRDEVYVGESEMLEDLADKINIVELSSDERQR